MSNTLRSLRNFGIYLLPALLLVIAGVSFMALLFYPVQPSIAVVESQATSRVNQDNWQTHAEALFAALLADALRELQAEQETKVRTLMYRYESGPSAVTERPALLRIAPPAIENESCGSSRPSALIRL